jgi:choline dehydrogenase-like flavoprotein
MQIADFIVVGSGCTGAMAAQTLAEAGKNVLILDGGIHDDHYQKLQPQENFSHLRRTDEKQHRYLLGDKFESLPDDELGTGAQLTPARQFLIQNVDKFLPVLGENFSPMESLALGGLGGGWGLGCCVFSENELKLAGLPPAEMNAAYQLIADRIGINSEKDDARKFTAAHIQNTQPTPPPDPTAATLLKKYHSKKDKLNAAGFFLGRPALALLTEEKNGRKPASLRDMDFYDDKEKAAYRPAITIAELRKKPNVDYQGGWMVLSFTEEEDHVNVYALQLATKEKKTFHCRKLILAPGVLGTARIVLRSAKGGAQKTLPLLCNPYTYIPCIVPSRLGKKMPEQNSGFAQLSLFHDADGKQSDVAMASIYTYRSLMLFRLLRETPLNFKDGRLFMQHLLPALIIAGIHHPEKYDVNQLLQLEKDDTSPTGDHLHIKYAKLNSREAIRLREKKYTSVLRKLGAYALKKVRPENGASIHYAGSLPFSESEKELTLSSSGKLHGTKNVFVADGSGFRFLPAKGLTLSLMANAHLVAERAMKS